MLSSDFMQELETRGLISQITNKEALVQQLEKGPISLYFGIDPTIDSLHIGHLVPLLCLKRFQNIGHRPVVLIGKATSLIGDPSFKIKERVLNSFQDISIYANKIRKQISLFLDFNCGKNSAIIVDNYDWFGDMNLLFFLRDIGKYFSVNQMINKEAVKQRLNREECGISYTEFSYNLLQSYDFSELYKRYGVVLQVGGSDQWGNITSGINLIRRLYRKRTWGMSMPLITKADGVKFSKSEKNAIWLDSNKTSAYQFYQFWINVADTDVYRFLRFFTFLSMSEIDFLEKEDKVTNQIPKAQSVLAEEITKLVHGKEKLNIVKKITNKLFSNMEQDFKKSDFEELEINGIPTILVSFNEDLQQILINSNFVSSRSQARIIISSNAISINGKKQLNPGYKLKKEDKLFGRYTLLRFGKKNHCLLLWK